MVPLTSLFLALRCFVPHSEVGKQGKLVGKRFKKKKKKGDCLRSQQHQWLQHKRSRSPPTPSRHRESSSSRADHKELRGARTQPSPSQPQGSLQGSRPHPAAGKAPSAWRKHKGQGDSRKKRLRPLSTGQESKPRELGINCVCRGPEGASTAADY